MSRKMNSIDTSGLDREPITLDTKIEVGDVIGHILYEWLVESIQPDGTFSTLHRDTGSGGDFTDYMNRWTNHAFTHYGYWLMKPHRTYRYDPTQAGDQDDDI